MNLNYEDFKKNVSKKIYIRKVQPEEIEILYRLWEDPLAAKTRISMQLKRNFQTCAKIYEFTLKKLKENNTENPDKNDFAMIARQYNMKIY